MNATVFTEALHPMEPIVAFEKGVSIDEVIVAASQTIVVGQVLGAVGVPANETATVAYGAGNTGNFTLGAVTIGSNALDGVYNGVMLTAGATAAFELQAPDGTVVGTGKIGTAFSGPISFTITAGGAAAVVGDTFNVTVLRPFNEAGEQFKAWNPAATDGSQVAVAVALYPAVTASGQTAKIAAMRRQGAVRGADLTWNGSATNNQIAEGVNQLARKNIVLR